MTHPVLIAGEWRASQSIGTFHADDPATGQALPDEYPVSGWADADQALSAAAEAGSALGGAAPEQLAQFLNRFAERLEARKAEIVEQAHRETALPRTPRLAEVELPRTTNQLRQAAAAAAEGSWALPTIDTKAHIRSCLGPIGPVVVFGPNNFPFAFSAVAGGDFAAAIAAGNPVIAKGHPLHPSTTRLLAEEAFAAISETGLPPATVQLLYHMEPASGLRLVSDGRVGASAFTGSRAGGLALKAAADPAGKLIYLELSSINPVVVLPGALTERGPAIAEEFAASCLLGGGQFCTNPGLVILLAGSTTDQFIELARQAFDRATPATLLSSGVARSLKESVRVLREAGAQAVTAEGANTLLRVSGEQFLGSPHKLQTEAFGPAALLVVVRDAPEAVRVINNIEGSLTGCVYSDTKGGDDEMYADLAPRLRARVGRLLNDKMPTGVAVSPAMNHGGPYPATSHPGFTAVGIPASLRRFSVLQCYDNVRPARLPAALGNRNPNGRMWRIVDGRWTQSDIDA